MTDTLVIFSGLSEPPSEPLYFRYFTAVAKVDYCYDVLIESEKDYIDMYYKYLKEKGLYDFVYEIVTPEDNVDAIRVDIENNYPRTILTDKITSYNMDSLVNSLKSLTKIEYLY